MVYYCRGVMSFMNSVQTAFSTQNIEHDSAKIADFAHRMGRIPRKAVCCEVYGTISVVVDRKHATNIFRKVFGHKATSAACCDALGILQDRLDGDY